MRTILHASDLHFGAHHAPERARALLASIGAIAPDVVAISGDLTQRATAPQFRAALAFLGEIRVPIVVVPGNHDLPLHHVALRLLAPRARWCRFLGPDLAPAYVDSEVAVLGLDTTRRFTIKGGHVKAADLGALERRLVTLPSDVCRVLVCHHPLALSARAHGEYAARGGRGALERLARAGIDVVLSGHVHESDAAWSSDRTPGVRPGVLLVSAGSTTSDRGRRSELERSSFNVLRIDAGGLTVATHVFSPALQAFRAVEPTAFPYGAHRAPALAP